ncbi:MAG TPA: DNA cytosine methyltransferase [Dehalococcoidia bacterium]|nr:DNA cytosine methyltransferase [Dehalococcoidia bacterium]
MGLSVLEICAGAGGEAIGLEAAGFEHRAAVEIDPMACATLRMNRPSWQVIESDVRSVNGRQFEGVDLLAGGVPCPPFSIAGKQLGRGDERDLFPEALRLVREARPAAVLLENVRGFASAKFAPYRAHIRSALQDLGFTFVDWRVLNASGFDVPQLRPRFILVALRSPFSNEFRWPLERRTIGTVASAIGDLVASSGWPGAAAWMSKANAIAPTLVGGSKKHGGPDLGPTRARRQWATLGVDGLGLANEPPIASFPPDGLPRLTLRMVARLQGFPDDWGFAGRKTAAYKQIGNALPPPVAQSVGRAIHLALTLTPAPRYPESDPQERFAALVGAV